VRTPIQTIHFRLMCGETLGKRIILVIAVIPAGKKNQREQGNHDDIAPGFAVLRCITVAGLSPFSAFFRHGSILISRRSGYDVQRLRNHIKFFAVQGEDLSIDHYIHRRIKIEFDVGDGLAFSEGMVDVRPVIKARQFSD
jgi:hypothetical protein